MWKNLQLVLQKLVRPSSSGCSGPRRAHGAKAAAFPDIRKFWANFCNIRPYNELQEIDEKRQAYAKKGTLHFKQGLMSQIEDCFLKTYRKRERFFNDMHHFFTMISKPS